MHELYCISRGGLGNRKSLLSRNIDTADGACCEAVGPHLFLTFNQDSPTPLQSLQLPVTAA